MAHPVDLLHHVPFFPLVIGVSAGPSCSTPPLIPSRIAPPIPGPCVASRTRPWKSQSVPTFFCQSCDRISRLPHPMKQTGTTYTCAQHKALLAQLDSPLSIRLILPIAMLRATTCPATTIAAKAMTLIQVATCLSIPARILKEE